MDEREIDGTLFYKMLVSGLKCLKTNIDEVNDLNVFPIPDGDTGDNMFSTLLGGIKNVSDPSDDVLRNMAKPISDGVLLGARGNSGVILSQMICGMCEEFMLHERVDVDALGKAFSRGVDRAYASVAVPVEGTMLTVLRGATQYANDNINENTTVKEYLTNFLDEGERVLRKTPDMLPVLKEAGVVDSGGAGVLYIMLGATNALKGEGDSDITTLAASTNSHELDFSLFNENSVMQFGYCTEFLLQLTHAKTNIEAFDLETMKKEISVYGDSLVAVKTGTIVKIHIHTLTPGAVLDYAQRFGEFLTLKIENMTLQHNETIKKKENVFPKNLTRKKFATVAVADGEGVINAFKELGADLIIDGGQGNNPSVETFLNAFDAINSDVIFVLPDNNNIRMAAHEAAELYSKSDVRVLDAKSLGDGYAALSAMDFSCENADEIVKSLQSEIDGSVCACVSRSIRDTAMDGLQISKGEYIGFVDKDIIVANADRKTAVIDTLDKLGAKEKSFIVVFCGESVDESEWNNLNFVLSEKYPDAEIYGLDGGQEIYDYIIVLQ